TDVYPRGIQPATGRVMVSGRLLAPQAPITLNYGWGSSIRRKVAYTLRRSQATSTNLVARNWAQMKVDALSVFPDKNRQALESLGREFNLVTPGTSLLVLENVDQYVRYRIAPPASEPQMLAEYHTRMIQETATAAKTREERLARLLPLWIAQVKWWSTKFKYPANFRFVDLKKKGRASYGANDSSGEADVRFRAGDVPLGAVTAD